MNENTIRLKDVIVSAMQDKKAQQIVGLDLSSLDGTICDTFVVCHAESTVQVAAIVAGVEEATTKELDEKPFRVQGLDNSLWVAMDYGDVMVHVFQTEMREFYGLEDLWSEADLTNYLSEE